MQLLLHLGGSWPLIFFLLLRHHVSLEQGRVLVIFWVFSTVSFHSRSSCSLALSNSPSLACFSENHHFWLIPRIDCWNSVWPLMVAHNFWCLYCLVHYCDRDLLESTVELGFREGVGAARPHFPRAQTSQLSFSFIGYACPFGCYWNSESSQFVRLGFGEGVSAPIFGNSDLTLHSWFVLCPSLYWSVCPSVIPA